MQWMWEQSFSCCFQLVCLSEVLQIYQTSIGDWDVWKWWLNTPFQNAVLCSFPDLHDLINYCREGTRAECSASLPPPWFVCSWFMHCLTTHYLLCFLVLSCAYVFMGPQGMRWCLHMQARHLYPLRHNLLRHNTLFIRNYSLRKACRCKVLLCIFLMMYSNTLQQRLAFFVWSLAHKATITLISLYCEWSTPTRTMASLASIIVQINVEALQMTHKVIVNIVFINIIITSRIIYYL